MDRVGRHHRPLAAIGKGSCSLRLYQVPERGQQRQGVAHRRRDVAAQAGSHQNRREQKFASCSELGFRILPRGAGAGRGRAVLEAELLLEAPAGRLEAQTQRGRSSLRETEPPASGSGAGAGGRGGRGERGGGAACSAALPLGPGVGSGGSSRTKGRPRELCRGAAQVRG